MSISLACEQAALQFTAIVPVIFDNVSKFRFEV